MLGLLFPLLLASQAPQSPRPVNAPPPLVSTGQTIEAHDGDSVFIHGRARLRVVHRSDAAVRAIYNPDKRFLVVLVDYVDPASGMPDGKVDSDYRFDDIVMGFWPLGNRWEGSAVVDDYYGVGPGQGPDGPAAIGLTTDKGLIQVFSAFPSTAREELFGDTHAVAILRSRVAGRGEDSGRETLDEAEARIVAVAAAQADARIARDGPPQRPAAPSGTPTAVAPAGTPRVTTPSTGPVRVGGTIAAPKKIVDVRPAYPPDAQRARIQGTVVIEATIAPDGRVWDARILRHLPMLDQAAIDAVKQWKYEPTILGGTAVSVIMTVTVSFALQ